MNIKIIENDFKEMARIEQAAYAGSFQGTQDELKELEQIFAGLTEAGDIKALGIYDKDLMACVLQYNFTTNFHNKNLKAAGIGSLAVDLLHKKKKLAQQLITYSINQAAEAGALLYYLYPFNARFYRNFGFGYGSPMYTYCVAPKDFIDKGDRQVLSYGSEADYDDVIEFYNKCAKETHGMSLKTSGDIKKLYRNKMGKLLLAKDETGIIGYMFYSQKGLCNKDDLAQKLHVREILYNRQALLAFASFFNSQMDQIDYIELATHDQYFNHVLTDTSYVAEPRTQDIIAIKVADKALGLMPLALDPQALLDLVDVFLPCKLVFDITHPKGSSKTASMGSGEVVHLQVSINEFSSWVTGVVTLEALYQLGQLETKTPHKLSHIDQVLHFKSPRSLTSF